MSAVSILWCVREGEITLLALEKKKGKEKITKILLRMLVFLSPTTYTEEYFILLSSVTLQA